MNYVGMILRSVNPCTSKHIDEDQWHINREAPTWVSENKPCQVYRSTNVMSIVSGPDIERYLLGLPDKKGPASLSEIFKDRIVDFNHAIYAVDLDGNSVPFLVPEGPGVPILRRDGHRDSGVGE